MLINDAAKSRETKGRRPGRLALAVVAVALGVSLTVVPFVQPLVWAWGPNTPKKIRIEGGAQTWGPAWWGARTRSGPTIMGGLSEDEWEVHAGRVYYRVSYTHWP
jgi:hypothetical protein